MSRIGLKVIEVPSTVKVEVLEGTVKVTGPKGELSVAYPKYISFKFEENKIHLVLWTAPFVNNTCDVFEEGKRINAFTGCEHSNFKEAVWWKGYQSGLLDLFDEKTYGTIKVCYLRK